MTLLLPLLLAAAGGVHDTRDLDVAVAAFTGKPIGQEGGARAPVDARLRLAACGAPDLSWQSDRHSAVVVRCAAPAWRIYVPVLAAPAPARAAPTIAAAAAAPLAVRAEPMVRRGDPVTVEARSAGFSITREGVAMGDAAPGARLLVRVDDRKPPVQAVAVEPGRVVLPSFAQ